MKSPKQPKTKIKIQNCPMSIKLQILLYNLGVKYLEEAYDIYLEEGDWGLLGNKYNFEKKTINELKKLFQELNWNIPKLAKQKKNY